MCQANLDLAANLLQLFQVGHGNVVSPAHTHTHTRTQTDNSSEGRCKRVHGSMHTASHAVTALVDDNAVPFQKLPLLIREALNKLSSNKTCREGGCSAHMSASVTQASGRIQTDMDRQTQTQTQTQTHTHTHTHIQAHKHTRKHTQLSAIHTTPFLFYPLLPSRSPQTSRLSTTRAMASKPVELQSHERETTGPGLMPTCLRQKHTQPLYFSCGCCCCCCC